MADINDAELAELRQAHALLKSLHADSTVGMDFKRLVKKAFPKASIPELEAIEKTEELGTGLTKKVDEIQTALTKKIDDFLEARNKEKEETQVAAFAATIDKIAKERGYTKEGTEKLLGLMKERGIQNPEDAAIIFETTQPKPTPKPREFSSRMNFITSDGKEDEQFDKLMRDPEQFMVDEMLTALAEGKE